MVIRCQKNSRNSNAFLLTFSLGDRRFLSVPCRHLIKKEINRRDSQKWSGTPCSGRMSAHFLLQANEDRHNPERFMRVPTKPRTDVSKSFLTLPSSSKKCQQLLAEAESCLTFCSRRTSRCPSRGRPTSVGGSSSLGPPTRWCGPGKRRRHSSGQECASPAEEHVASSNDGAVYA
jgi:hypothetical protein